VEWGKGRSHIRIRHEGEEMTGREWNGRGGKEKEV